MTTIRFHDRDATLRYTTYGNGSTAILLRSASGEALGAATTALDELPQPGHVFIKDWSENAGVLEALQSAGIVGEVVRLVPAGFVHAAEVALL